MSIIDITQSGQSTSSLKSATNRNLVGQQIGKVERFADNVNISKCYQFGTGAMGAVASAISGDCSSDLFDTIGNILKNNAIVKFIASGLDKINNAIDGVKSFGKQVVGSITNSPLGLRIRGFYCGVLAPALQILLMAVKSLIAIPHTILNALYKIIDRLKDIANNTTNKLFDCMGALIQGLSDGVGKLNVNISFTFADLLAFLDDIEGFLKNCEVIAQPIIGLFNSLLNPCSSVSMRTIFDEIGMSTPGADENHMCSAADVVAFLERRKKIGSVELSRINSLLNKFNPFGGLFDGASKLNELGRTYVQYGIAKLYEKAMGPLHRLEAYYNNLLTTRSRFLGILVNSTIGWLFPTCGSSKFADNRIKRRKYSILDVVNILDSMNGCNSYICGNINNQVTELLAELEISRFGKWINPLVNANEKLSKFIDVAFAQTFGNNGDIAQANIATNNIDIDFIKSILPYSTTVKVA